MIRYASSQILVVRPGPKHIRMTKYFNDINLKLKRITTLNLYGISVTKQVHVPRELRYI